MGEQAEALKRQLSSRAGDPGAQLLLDLSGVSFVDSRGLEVLVEVSKELVKSGRSLKLCGLPVLIREVLSLTDLLDLFECFKDASSARESLG